jgi:hypothetical protein
VTDLLTELHDEIDYREKRQNQIAEDVRAIVSGNLKRLIEEKGGDLGQVMEALAGIIGDEIITDATTQEFQRAAHAAVQRGRTT